MKKKGCLPDVIILIIIAFISFSFINISNTKRITNFTLKNIDNKQVSLNSYKNAKGFIVVFTCNKCPMAKFYTDRLNKLSNQYKSKGIYLLAINSMDTLAYKEESFVLMQKKARTEKLNFPYLQDKMQLVAKQFQATHTPQAFVIWKNAIGSFEVKYQGSIDDNAGDATNAKPLLAMAVNELLQNKPITYPNTESFGCRIYYRGETKK